MASVSKTIVVALGGNAIVRPGGDMTVAAQFDQTNKTAGQLVDLVRAGHRLVITHGNGPQVGHSLRRVELAADDVAPLPLEMCVAETQGMIGYMIAQCMMNALRRAGIERTVSTIVTTSVVDANDPAMANPTKPIGQIYKGKDADARRRDGWTLKETAPGEFRRVVPSPEPVRLLEMDTIKTLVDGGELVIACGGGGVPVVQHDDGTYEGAPAVIDKDLATGVLATGLSADVLLILTNVSRVQKNFGRPDAESLETLTVSEAKTLLAAGEFPPGTMGPKISAAVRFLENVPAQDPLVVLTSNEMASAALHGNAGTRITRN